MRRLLLLLLAGCTAESDPWGDYFGGDGTLLEDSHANVVQRFFFTEEVSPGIADGFDLDGAVSPDGEADSCGHGDLQHPDGTAGIDNQLAKVWSSLLEPLVGEAVESLLQAAINEGRFLLGFELVGVDSLVQDDDVTLHLFRGSTEPLVSAEALLAPDQTLRVDPSTPTSTVEGVSIDNGMLTAGPVSFTLPIEILEANFPMVVHDGRLQMQIDEDGTMRGVIGGSITVADVLDELLATDAAAEAALVLPIFENNADMGFDGESCREFSTAFAFEATTAFVVH